MQEKDYHKVHLGLQGLRIQLILRRISYYKVLMYNKIVTPVCM